MFFFSTRKRQRENSASVYNAFSWLDGFTLGNNKEEASEKIGVRFQWEQGRMLIVFGIFLFSFLSIFARLFQLNIVLGDHYRVLSEENRYRTQIIRPPRGIIYDRYGKPLVENEPSFRLLWDPNSGVFGSSDDSYVNVNWTEIAHVLGWGSDEMDNARRKVEEAENPIVLASNLSREQVIELEIRHTGPALRTEMMPIRSYPYGESMAHVLGYTGEASSEEITENDQVSFGSRVGKAGLEKEFDLLLRGRPGKQVLEVDVRGASLNEKKRQEPVQGQVVQTSLDAELQDVSYKALRREIEGSSSASGGAVVAQDPRSGEVLALVSYPSFDPNALIDPREVSYFKDLSEDKRDPLYNRSLSGAYPPGSIFKPIVASAALEEKTITPQQVVNCKGAISIGSFVFRDWDLSGHGNVSLVEGLAKSCDIYFYTVGGGYAGVEGLGPERIALWSRQFGLGSVLGINFPWEAQGLVPDPAWKEAVKGERWYLGNTYHFSIGQGDLLVTPLQITNALGAVVNGGTLYRPSFKLRREPEIIRENLISEETLRWIREGLHQVCQPGGTAYPFFDFPVPIGGKTGTAETGRGDDTHAWFVVVAPLEKPEIILTVFLENGGSGSHDAAPVAREIMDWWAEHRLDADKT